MKNTDEAPVGTKVCDKNIWNNANVSRVPWYFYHLYPRVDVEVNKTPRK